MSRRLVTPPTPTQRAWAALLVLCLAALLGACDAPPAQESAPPAQEEGTPAGGAADEAADAPQDGGGEASSDADAGDPGDEAAAVAQDGAPSDSSGENASSAASAADARFVALRDAYLLDVLRAYPVVSTYLGGSGYDASLEGVDGRLRDLSPEGIAAEAAVWRDYEARLAEIDAEALADGKRIDHKVMQAQLAFLRHQIEDLAFHQLSVETYVATPFSGVDWWLQGMTEREDGGRGTLAEWDTAIARLEAIPPYLAQAQAHLAAGAEAGALPDPQLLQKDGVDGAAANAAYFRADLPAQARDLLAGADFAPEVLDRLNAEGEQAAQAYEAYGAFLAQTYDLSDTTPRYAIGEEEYAWRMANNLQLTESPGELFTWADGQVAEIEAEAFALAERIAGDEGLELDWSEEASKRAATAAVLDLLAENAPADDEQLFAWYREVSDRAIAYGREQDLFDVPQDYRLDIVETPPVLQAAVKAAYFPAPPFKGAGVGRFYLSPTGDDPALLALNNYDSIADLAVHEGFPGHDWHYKYMSEHRDQISNVRWLTPGAVQDQSAMWEDSMAAEGWALYSEALMAEPQPNAPEGFYSAGERLYELQGQLWRAVRVHVDTGLHTERLGYDEAVDYFSEHVLFAPGACAAADTDDRARANCEQAQREIYRYSKWPTQAITYYTGELAIHDLREAYRQAMGDAYTDKAFHARLMEQGTIPASYYADVFVEE